MHAGYKHVCIKVYFWKSNYALRCCVGSLWENNNEMGTTLIDGVIRGCREDSLHLFSARLSTMQFGGISKYLSSQIMSLNLRRTKVVPV